MYDGPAYTHIHSLHGHINAYARHAYEHIWLKQEERTTVSEGHKKRFTCTEIQEYFHVVVACADYWEDLGIWLSNKCTVPACAHSSQGT
jgi:hypothetical protein